MEESQNPCTLEVSFLQMLHEFLNQRSMNQSEMEEVTSVLLNRKTSVKTSQEPESWLKDGNALQSL